MDFVRFIASLFNNDFLVSMAFAIELIVCLFIFSPFIRKRDSFVILFIVSVIVIVTVSFILSLFKLPKTIPSLSSVITYILFLLLIFFCYDDKIMAIIFLGVVTLTSQHAVMSLSAIITNSVPLKDEFHFLFFFIVEIVCFTSTFLLFRFVIFRRLYRLYHASYINAYIIIMALILFLIIFVLYDYVRVSNALNIYYRLLDLLLCALSSSLLILELIRSNSFFDQAMMKKLMELEQKRYMALEQSMEQIKRKAHDIKYIEGQERRLPPHS